MCHSSAGKRQFTCRLAVTYLAQVDAGDLQGGGCAAMETIKGDHALALTTTCAGSSSFQPASVGFSIKLFLLR